LIQLPYDTILFAEAAQNAATLSNIRLAANESYQSRGSSVDVLKTRTGQGQPFIFGVMLMGDSDDIQRGLIDAVSMGKHNFHFTRFGVEGVSHGYMDLRSCPIPLKENDDLEVKFTEDKSTNVEASCVLQMSYGKVPDPKMPTPKQYKRIIGVRLTQGSSTAAQWTDTGVNLNNGDDAALISEADYEAIAIIPESGAADLKAVRLVHPNWNFTPGVPVMAIDVGADTPPDPMFLLPWRPTFKGQSPPHLETYDITGTATPIVTVIVGEV
jgi:hypothetical protein